MKKFLSAVSFFLVIIFLSACVNQRPAFIPEADNSYFQFNRSINIDIGNVIETRDSSAGEESSRKDPLFLPEWLLAFFYGGNEAVEMIGSYFDKYVFVAMSQGESFAALNIWADRFSVQYDFPMLAGSRIEKRMILQASIYPDYEYGLFFEKLVKNAYTGEYPGIYKEETYWIKIKNDNNRYNNEEDISNNSETYMFFILFSIDKKTMQKIIENMMAQTFEEVTSTREQAAAISRLRQNFFTGF